MKILVVGNGAREHALLWKLKKDAPSATLFVTRPNGGMASLASGVDLAPSDGDGLAGWAEGNDVTLTIVGPEAPLADGIVDRFERRRLPIFGPSASAARIEASKAFAKDLMARANVPTADFRTFDDWPAAEAYIEEVGGPLVVKASGLAAGKGAVICPSTEEALEAARDMLREDVFGEAGRKIVVEELMEGEELSVFGITDGRHVVLLMPSQDHKRAGEGDTGPNTGGMGAYAPVPQLDPGLVERVRESIFLPVLEAMEDERTPFRGLLYAGLMLTGTGPRVVEFNCRFGDPEAQAVLPLMESTLLELLLPVARGGSIADAEGTWSSGTALNTVLTSGGYPGEYQTGAEITIPAEVKTREDVLLFHGGTRLEYDDRLVTAGGRVLSVVGLGEDVNRARDASLSAAEEIHFEGKTFRRDIGWRALPSAEGHRA